MKNNFYIWFLLFSLSSCAITNKEVESQYSESDLPSTNELTLMDDFEKDQLDNNSISAFEDRAIEKVKEFFEYASIIQDTTIDKTLRKNALDQCQSLFYPDFGKIGINKRSYNIKEFLDSLYQSQIYLPSIADLLLSKKYHKSTKEDFYSGEVKFNYIDDRENGKMITILVKSEKIFGEDIHEVWEVYLKEASL